MDPSQSQPTDPAVPAQMEQVRNQDKMMLFLCYFGIFSVIPYAVVKDSDYVRWHAKQGVTFCGAAVGFWICWWIATIVLVHIHLGFLLSLLSIPVSLGLFALWIVVLVRAFRGERWRIPVVADLADMW